jgi:hypothetical protein
VEDVDLGVCKGRLYPGDPALAAVILPGALYLPFAPLLWFAREVAQAHGWTVLEVWDEYRDRSVDARAWVEERATAAVDRLGATRTLLVAKSLSSNAVHLAAERNLPGVWLTPLLYLPEIAEGFRQLRAPALLVGGGEDKSWDGELARSSRHEVLELEAADHSLQIPGEALASIDLLRHVVERIEEFLDEREK